MVRKEVFIAHPSDACAGIFEGTARCLEIIIYPILIRYNQCAVSQTSPKRLEKDNDSPLEGILNFSAGVIIVNVAFIEPTDTSPTFGLSRFELIGSFFSC